MMQGAWNMAFSAGQPLFLHFEKAMAPGAFGIVQNPGIV